MKNLIFIAFFALSFAAKGQMYMLGGGVNASISGEYTAMVVAHNVILQAHSDTTFGAGYLLNLFGSDPCTEGDYDESVGHFGLVVGTRSEILFGGSINRATILFGGGVSRGNLHVGVRILYRFKI